MNCTNVSANLTPPAKFNITDECALFDFVVYTVGVGSLSILGLVGNIVSFSVLLKDQSKTATAFLLRALAVADCLVLIAALPLYSAASVYPFTGYMKSYYDLYMNLLPFLWPSYLIPYTGTILLTVLVSLNRYMAVCKPFRSGTLCSTDQAKRHVIFVALFAVLYNIPRFFEYKKTEECVAFNQSREGFEISPFGANRYYRIIYSNIMYFVIMHGGPLLSLSFLNFKLIKALKKRAERRMEMGKGGYQQDVTLVLVVVIFVFIFCQTPTFLDHVFWTFLDADERTCGNWHYYYTAIVDMLAVTNSAVNFVIYILTSRKFRQSLATTCTGNADLLRLQMTATTRAEMTALTHHVNKENALNNHHNDV